MATVAAAAALLLVALQSERLSAVSRFQGLGVWTSAAGTLLLIATVVGGVQGSRGSRRWSYVLRYPPWWVGLPISGVIFVAVPCLVGESLLGEAMHSVWLTRAGELSTWVVGVPTIVAMTIWVATCRLVRGGAQPIGEATEPDAPSTPDIMSSAEALMSWIRTDEPLKPGGDDAFTHSSVGGQLTQLIREQVDHGGRDAAIALIGRVGSGKSSAISLCEKRFQGPPVVKPTVIFARVSLWPFDNTASAAEGILQALISALGQIADPQVVRDVPDRYLSAIGAAGGGWADLARLLRSSWKREDTLKVVEEVLYAVGGHVVLVIEDLERFRNRPHEGGGDSNSDRLQPIEALIYLLRRTMGVSILLACDRSSGRFDPSKLVGSVIEMPLLRPDHVWRVVWKFRSHCLEELEGSLIDPASAEAREELSLPQPDDKWSWQLLSDGRSSVMLPQAAIVRALETPRVIKAALREFRRRWGALKGEIDIDVLLCLCVLREAYPGVFEGLRSEYSHLSQGVSSDGVLEGSERSLADHVQELLKRAHEQERHKLIVTALLEFAFKLDHDENGSIGRPQGVVGPWGEHYWSRFVAVDSSADQGPSDQVLMAELMRQKRQTQGVWRPEFLGWFQECRFTRFSRLLSEHDHLRLMDEYFESRMEEEPSVWGGQASSMSRPVVDMLRNSAAPEADVRGRAERLITLAMIKNLPLVRELELALSTEDRRGRAVLSVSNRSELRRHVARTAENALCSAEEKFGEALRGGDQWTFHHIAFGVPVDSEVSPEFLPWTDPAKVASNLLLLARQKPEAWMPQLVCFCIERHASPSEHLEVEPSSGETRIKPGRVAEERVRAMFDLEDLFDVLKSSEYIPSDNRELLDHLNALRTFVRGASDNREPEGRGPGHEGQ